MLRDVALALVTGMLAGAGFGLARLPVPAPPTIAGVVGVGALALGWYLGRRLRP